MAGNIFRSMPDVSDVVGAGMQGYKDASAITSDITSTAANRQAAPQIAAGNFKGAAQTYGAAGMAADATTAVNNQRTADEKTATDANAASDRKAKALLDVSEGLKTVPQGQRTAALQRALPIFQQVGIDPSHFAGLTEDQLSDQTLDQFIATLGKTKDDYNLGDGQVRMSGATNQPIASGAPKHDWKEVTNPDGSTRFIDLAAPQGAPAPSAAQAPAAGSSGGFDAVYHGFVAPHEGGYTPSDGNGAPANYGINQKANPGVDVKSLTPQDAQTIYHDKYWVPSGADKLPPALQAVQFDTAVNMGVGAANSLLAQSGGDPQKYLQLREARYRAIAAADPSKAKSLPVWLTRNDDLAHYVAGQGAAPAPAVSGGIPGSAPGTKGGQKWTPDGKGNLISSTGDRKVDPTYDGVGAADPNVVKMVLDGRYPPPTGRAATDPKWQAVLQAASAQDPGFNAADYHTRYATRKDFTSGKAAQNITSLNTALGHIGDLDAQVDNLGNTPFHMLNAGLNMFANATGDPRVQKFNTTKAAVASELVRVFRQAGGTEGDIKDFQGPLDAANSPAQLHAVTQQMAKLLASRLDALSAQYTQGLGQDKAGIDFLTPKSQKIYSKLMGVDAGGGSARPPLSAFQR